MRLVTSVWAPPAGLPDFTTGGCLRLQARAQMEHNGQ
jgi:hypothetical protein